MKHIHEVLRWAFAGARCKLGGHQWKRAKRGLGNAGAQTCVRCGSKRAVQLRARKQPTVSV